MHSVATLKSRKVLTEACCVLRTSFPVRCQTDIKLPRKRDALKKMDVPHGTALLRQGYGGQPSLFELRDYVSDGVSQPKLEERRLAERVGFEPTVRLHAQRFSRPSQSTTLAPLRADRTRVDRGSFVMRRSLKKGPGINKPRRKTSNDRGMGRRRPP